jgi:hypothetical protein
VSTVSAANPFAVGQTVQFTGVLGMTQINNQTGTISAIGGSSGAWTFTANINSSAYTAYASGGTAIDTTYWTPFQGAGGRVRLGAGAFYISATVNFQNYCTLTGMGNWTLLKAQNGWAGGSNMINSTNGTSSMFDSRLENLRVDANAKAAITTVHLAQSWQNRCGWYNVTFTNFQGYGIVYQHGYGGAAVLEIDHCDFFPNDVAAACGAYFTNDASVGWLKLNVKNSTAASGGTQAVYGFWFDNRIIANIQGVDIETIGLGVNLTGAARLTGAGLSAGGTTPTYGNNCVVHCGTPWTGLINVSGVGLGGFTNMILDASRAYAIAAIEPFDNQLIWPPNSGRVFAGAVGTVSGTTLTLAWANGITMSRSSAGVYVCTLTTSFDGASAYDVICSSNDSTAPMCSVATNSATQFTVTTRNTSGTATDAGQFTVKVYHKP